MLTLPDSQAHEKCLFLMRFQWLNFTSWLLTVFESYYSFCRHFCYLQQKMTPKHILGCIDPSWQQKYLRDGSFLMDFWWLSFVPCYRTGLASNWDCWGNFAICKKWQPPKHLLDASTIPNTQQQNNLEDGSFFMHFQWIICVPFQNKFWKVNKWITGISTVEGKWIQSLVMLWKMCVD